MWILGRYIFICIDGHCVDIYGYYETDANHNQARFSRRCFFPTDSRCKIIGYPIGRGIDLNMLKSLLKSNHWLPLTLSCCDENHAHWLSVLVTSQSRSHIGSDLVLYVNWFARYYDSKCVKCSKKGEVAHFWEGRSGYPKHRSKYDITVISI